MKHKTKLTWCLALSLLFWLVASGGGLTFKEVATRFFMLWAGGLIWATLAVIFGDR